MNYKRLISITGCVIIFCIVIVLVFGCTYNNQNEKTKEIIVESTLNNTETFKKPKETTNITNTTTTKKAVKTTKNETKITETFKPSKTTKTITTTTKSKTTRNSKIETNKKEPINYVNRNVPSNNTIKSYMDYRCITSTGSNQYRLQRSAYTGDNGLRMVNGRYCIAVGSYYTTTIGQYIDVELKNGKVIKAILADCKADIHTDKTNRINPNGSVIEFVVDTNLLDSTAKRMGDISYVNGWNSKVINIRVYNKIEKF